MDFRSPGHPNSLVIFLFVGCCLLLMPQCQQKPPFQKDISRIQIDPMQIDRYEQLLFSLNPYRLEEELEPYVETYAFFLGDGVRDPWARQQLFAYVTDPQLIELYEDIQEAWPGLEELSEQLTLAFRYYRAHFPEAPLPRLYSYVSGIDHELPVRYAEGHMAIGLDNYLGRDYPTYTRIGIPRYRAIRMDKEYVPADVMRTMAEVHLGQRQYEPETLLDFMLYEGRLLYFADCMLPLVPDSVKIGYTARQMEWVQQNSGQVWSWFLDNELLFSSDRQMIQRFAGEAPFTSAFSRDSAPRTAAWTGWQIVREYMRRHPGTSLDELFDIADARHILHESRYRGR
jgi:hypothetical protein